MVSILHVISGDLWAGAENLVFQLAVEQNRGNQSRVSVLLFNEGTLCDRLMQKGIACRVLDEGSKSIIQIAFEVWKIIGQKDVRLVHSHGDKEMFVSVIGGHFRKVRQVRTVHGLMEFNEKPFGLRKKLIALTTFLICRYAIDLFIFVSDSTKRNFPIRKMKGSTTVIRNGINCCAVRASANDVCLLPGNAAFRVGYFGRLVPVKRLDLVLDVFRTIGESGPENSEFFIVGDGPEEVRVKESYAASGDVMRIHWLGFQSNALAIMGQMNAIVLMSDHEGLPMVVLEAICLNVPILARSVGDISDLLQRHNAGWVLRETSRVGLETELREIVPLLTEPRKVSELSEELTAVYCAKAHEEIYQRLVNGGGCSQ